MSFVDRLLAVLGYTKRAAPQTGTAPEFLREGVNDYVGLVPDYSHAYNQASLYQRLSWIYIAVSTVAQTAAGSRLAVKKLDGEKTKEIVNHPFELLLRNPNPLHSRFELLNATFAYYKLAGNAYWWLNRTSQDVPPSEIWLIPPHLIRPIPDHQSYIKGYLYSPEDRSVEIPLENWEICHFKSFHPTNRFVGMSAIETLGTVALGEIAMQQWNTNFFAKENAKSAGALVFADPVQDEAWEKMKAEIRSQHGGVERRMMMLRNAGQGGVSWLSFGISQRDMEFLEGRNFNKEEVYAALAPGLSSKLAVNATEANSVAGKATFNEDAVWPVHQAIGEKITNVILPSYDASLVAEFDDVRLSDRNMDLQEQQIAFKVMTVAEVREKYYQLEPLGDERDEQLVDGPGLTPEPLQGQAPQGAPQGTGAEVDGQTTSDDTPEDTPLKADMRRWQRKAIKRLKSGRDAACDFESEAIPPDVHAAIEHGLEHCDDAGSVVQLFEQAAIKASAAKNAPDDSERRKRERRLKAAMTEYFDGLRERVLVEVKDGAR